MKGVEHLPQPELLVSAMLQTDAIGLRVEGLALNNRELAIGIWVGVFIAAVSVHQAVRDGLYAVVRILFSRVILASLIIASIYIVSCIALLATFGMWDWSNLKTSLVWAITFAFVTMFDVNRVSKDSTFYKETVRDILGATAAIIFVAEAYTFSLLAELMVVPIVAFAAMMQAFAEKQSEHKIVGEVMGWIVVIAGLSYVVYGANQAYANVEVFATFSTLREFLVPILLSVMFLPFIFLLSVYVAYELTFSRLKSAKVSPPLITYTKLRAMLAYTVNLELLRRWNRNLSYHSPLETRSDVNRSIKEVKRLARLERVSPYVPATDGWSPYTAKAFLQEHGLITGDYHELSGWWHADSNYKKLDDGILSDSIAYYVEGNS